MHNFSSLDRARLQRGSTHLHQLGPRAIAELLADLTARVGGGAALFALLNEYERLSPKQVHTACASGFPPRLRAVPAELRRAVR